MNISNYGVTYPKGFTASGVACGLKKNNKKDLALVFSKVPANAAGVFTKNLVKGHSLQLTASNIAGGKAQAVVINSGNANACVGEQGKKDAMEMAAEVAKFLNIQAQHVLTGSTGVIGVPLNMEAVKKGIACAVSKLSETGGHEAEEAIMTTDTIPKEASVEIELGGIPVRIGGMAKGSGMIHPNMATMIGVITTDAAIDSGCLKHALKKAVDSTFNRVSVDGDTSVCDMVVILANGLAGNEEISCENGDYKLFVDALTALCKKLAKMIAADGEGATKLLEINVNNAPTAEDALLIAQAIARSPLVKTAMFGEDANWGRIFTAAGYSGAQFNPDLVDIYIGDLMTCSKGTALPFDEERAKELLTENEIIITVDLNQGSFSETVWTCDFSYDYVKINGSYRS